MEKNVSIAIPVYNGAKWLRESVASAVACTVALEIVICDDGSTDDSVSIIREFAAKDSRIILHRNEKNLGLVGNWNKCLQLVRGEWVKFLFQDDKLQPGSVEKMVAAAQSGDHLIAAKRNFVFVAESSEESHIYYTKKVLTLDNVAEGKTQFSPEAIADLASTYIARNFIGEPSTVMFRRSVVEELGEFDPGLKQICDLEFWLRIAAKYGLKYVPEAVIDFTVHDESVSAQNAAMKASGLDSIRLVDQLLHDEKFEVFRSELPRRRIKHLRLWLRVHAYEARSSMDHKQLEKLFAERPEVQKAAYQFGNGILFSLLKMRRR